ncbi:MAG: type II secretion system F family protein [Magnetococcus sp. DMHC-1]
MSAIKSSDLVIFSNQFASMLRSHLPLLQVLQNLARETPNTLLREAVEDIGSDLEQGVDFGEALEAHPRVFDEVYVNVVKSGMMSGRLAQSITQISVYLAKAEAVGSTVRKSLSYPIFLLVAFFGVFNAMVFMILPRFRDMFASMNQKLPKPTQFLLDMGDVWASNWYFILGGLAGIFITFGVWTATTDGRAIWDEFKLRLIWIGPLWRMAALSRFLRTFAVQIENEVEILHALRLAASSTSNRFIEESILDIADDVERGLSLTAAFETHDIFSGIVLQMISSGEEAGTLDELLLSAADYYERLLDSRISMVTGLINPILTVLIGISIAGMLIAAFLPVFEMGKTVGAR